MRLTWALHTSATKGPLCDGHKFLNCGKPVAVLFGLLSADTTTAWDAVKNSMNIPNVTQAEQSAEYAVKPHIRASVAYSDHDVELMWDQGMANMWLP